MTEKTTATEMTPMMRQYFELKKQAHDAILFFRMGDFYEIFDTDALEVAPKLELVLTSRERGDQKRVPFCGVPHHSAKNYWIKLIKMGYKVALADQTQDPKLTKGLVERKIVKTLTPGSIDELEGLEQHRANYLAAFYEEPSSKRWAALICDVSTGELRLGGLEREEDIVMLIEKYLPKEILARSFYHAELKKVLEDRTYLPEIVLSGLPEAILRNKSEQVKLINHLFHSRDGFEALPCGPVAGGPDLLASVFAYLKALGINLENFTTVHPINEPKTMQVDETMIRDLELFESSRLRQLKGSLFSEINHTSSPMGARRLAKYLAAPLVDESLIKQRQDAVRFFYESPKLSTELRQIFMHMPDLRRLATRIVNKKASPQELASVRISLEKATSAFQMIMKTDTKSSLIKSQCESLKLAIAPLKLLQSALCEQPQRLGFGDQVFSPGYDSILDQACDLVRNGSSKIKQYEQALRDKTGISSLKIKNHKSFGLLIEVTKSNLSRVPDEFIRRQTMVNNERFVTAELTELDQCLASANEKAVEREAHLYGVLLDRLCEQKEIFQQVSEALAIIDVALGLAYLAKTKNYCCPQQSRNKEIELQGARHPVVESFVGIHKFTPNDFYLSGTQKHVLITGPNMAGKSTFMRQLALIAILHQTGSFVPAKKAKLPIFDRIFTRVGASDDLARGQSTFLVEMSETATILREATARSLVILDEVGRGTSTQDGLAIARAVLADLAERINCFSFFATHYHELASFAGQYESVRLLQTEVVEEQKQLTFTHRLIEGASGHSFGIEVAKLAGLPRQVIERARGYLDTSPPTSQVKGEVSHETPVSLPLEKHFGNPDSQNQFQEGHLAEISKRLEKLNIRRTTPLQALNILNDLKDLLTHQQSLGLFD